VRARLGFAVAGAAVVQTAWILIARPPGERLRTMVDVLAVEGLLLAVAGALLIADRPFLATRRLLGLGDATRPAPRVRSAGWFALLAGGVLFAAAAVSWALAGSR
jgi:hypothetical protein